MYTIIKHLPNGIKEYVCDSVNDLNPDSDLSTIEVFYSAVGSRCYCISNDQTYILNSNKQWTKAKKKELFNKRDSN